MISKKLDSIRKQLNHGDSVTQDQLDRLLAEIKDRKELLRKNEKDESFTLVNNKGEFLDLSAPRWFCHLVGLRHKSVHVLLQWQSPGLGKVFVLQVRSWTKSDSPGHLDISVGGHVIGRGPVITLVSAYREMEEELGITKADLRNGELDYKKGYESHEERPKDNFYNTEWRDVYVGEITTASLDKIRFNDNEVVGLYLCPESQAQHLLEQKLLPIASALKYSLPYCI